MTSSDNEPDNDMLRAIRTALDDDEAAKAEAPSRAKPKLRVVGGDAPVEEPAAPVTARRPVSTGSATGRPGTEAPAASEQKPKRERRPSRIGRWLRGQAQPWAPLMPFAVATLAPVPLLVLAAVFGGGWSALALLWLTALTFAIDEFAKRRGIAAPGPRPEAEADRLSQLLAILHFPLLALAIWSLSGAGGHGFFGWIATFLAFGLWFGQVSNSNAHELIHRHSRRLFRLGMWVYVSLLFGHHTSAHRLVHHRFVATADDPNTAPEGEHFYGFLLRAWPGAFVAGYEMEAHRLGQTGFDWRRPNPYVIYMAGAFGFVIGVTALFGFDGLLAYLLLCAHAQVQLLLSDYVQHYGLQREKLPSGTVVPAGPQHSWDAPHPLSGLMMLNATRHADHHSHPGRPYTELALSPGGRAPLLPYSLPLMATIALVPPLWHRVMDRRLTALKRRGAA
ncbi:MAG: fatty acid desaturase [Albidovulum sp.]